MQEFLTLRENHELRPLYNAANTLYAAATSCTSDEDCVCLHREAVSRALEKVRKLHISYARMTNAFILDEQGVLVSEKGRGVLVSLADLDVLEHHLDQCDKPRPREVTEGEAQTMLRALNAVESTYYLDQHQYAPLPSVGYAGGCQVPYQLGFQLEGCDQHKLRYTYSVRVPKANRFVAEARSAVGMDHPITPGCAIADVWTVDQDEHLVHVVNAAQRCAGKTSPPGQTPVTPRPRASRVKAKTKKP